MATHSHGKRDRPLAIPTEPNARREWFQAQLRQFTNPATELPWSQADIARKAGCSEGMVSNVYKGTRTTGDVTKMVQAVTAYVLKKPIPSLFGTVCTRCTHCGTAHRPKRMLAAEPAAAQ